MFGKNAIFRRNTVQRGGNCEGIRAIDNGSVIELNRVTDSGNLQHDGSAINVGTPNMRVLESHIIGRTIQTGKGSIRLPRRAGFSS